MNQSLPSEVVLDLLPLYLADEVSPITRQLVEDCLRHDPQLAERVQLLRNAPPSPPAATPPPDLGLRTLRRARKLIARERWFMSFALMFTGFAASFQFSSGSQGLQVEWLASTNPGAALACAGAAVVLWTAFLWQRRRMRV